MQTSKKKDSFSKGNRIFSHLTSVVISVCKYRTDAMVRGEFLGSAQLTENF